MNPPSPPPPPTTPIDTGRLRIRYGVVYCTICDLDARYCRGHATDASQAKDGAESMLAQKIAEVVGKRGGR